MTGIDLLLIGGVLAFVFLGFSTGMVQTFGSLVGIFAGAYVSGHIFEAVGGTFSFVFLGNENLAKLVIEREFQKIVIKNEFTSSDKRID